MKKKIFILIIVISASLFAYSVLAEYKLEAGYPEIEGVKPEGGLIPYIRYIFVYGLATIGLLALGALVVGGLMYMSAGSITSTEKAREVIWGAIGGLLLGLSAYLILNTINPDLVKLKIDLDPINIPISDPVGPIEIETCTLTRTPKPECHPSNPPLFEKRDGCTLGICKGTQTRTRTCGADGCWSAWADWNDVPCVKIDPGCTGTPGNRSYCSHPDPKKSFPYPDEAACLMICPSIGGTCEEPPHEAPT